MQPSAFAAHSLTSACSNLSALIEFGSSLSDLPFLVSVLQS